MERRMSLPRIVKPYDWQCFSQCVPLFVVIEGALPSGCVCRLWTRDAFAALPLLDRPVLADAEVVTFSQDLHTAIFWNLEAWRECVLGVVVPRKRGRASRLRRDPWWLHRYE